ncbi:MAG: hypothetical protein WC470_03410 [Candidatus Paceibacterota bacterium]
MAKRNINIVIALFGLVFSLISFASVQASDCGIANGQTFPSLSATSANLCVSGRVYNFGSNYSGAIGWKWTCVDNVAGIYSAPSFCTAKKQTASGNTGIIDTTNRYCGSSSNQSFSSTPTSNLCAIGTASAVSASNTNYAWTCSFRGMLLANCSAQRTAPAPTPINGQCGSSNGQTLSSAPTNLCNSGNASTVSGSGPWTWTCSGQNNGTTASCSAQKTIPVPTPINGQCGTANGKNYPSTTTAFGFDTQCANGTPNNSVFPAAGTSTTWICSGSNGGVNSGTCFTSRLSVAINGACGSSNGQTLSSAPTNLCNSGNASTVSGSGPWTWTCVGQNNGTTASCSAQKTVFNPNAINGACGSSNGKAIISSPKYLCNMGTASAVSGSGPWTWTCVGQNNGTTASCSAQKTSECTISYSSWGACQPNNTQTRTLSSSSPSGCYETPVLTQTCVYAPILNGACGSSNGQTLSSAPTNLCNSGNASTVSGSGPWTWTCVGENNGTTASCSAQKTIPVPTPINGQCGSSNGQTLSSAPTNLCSAGVASAVNGSGPWTWTCAGQNNGATVSCSANAMKSCTIGYSNWGVCQSNNTQTRTGYTSPDNCATLVLTQACTYIPAPTNGQCGSSNGQTLSSAPTNLCNSGNASTVNGSGPWTWICSGQNNGATVSCSAQKAAPTPTPINGQCGSSDGQSSNSKPVANLCSAGVVSAVNGSGPWTWTCAGQDGGTTASCSISEKKYSQSIALLVDENTYNALPAEIKTFKQDIENDSSQNVFILHNNWTAGAAVREELVKLYKNEGLTGAILIGDMPIMSQITDYNQKRYPEVPSDFYYQKLDDKFWFEETATTFIQTINQKSDSRPTIWTSRLMAPEYYFSQKISLLKSYFDKNHKYRLGQITYEKKMVAIDSISSGILNGTDMTETVKAFIGKIANYTGLYADPSNVETAYAIDHQERKVKILQSLIKPYEILNIMVHGNSTAQWVGTDTWIKKEDLMANPPAAMFIALESCSNGNIKNINYIAGWYLFAGNSLIVKANTVDTMYVGSDITLENGEQPLRRFKDYQSLAAGATFGEIYKNYNGENLQGMLFGDPTLSIR